MKKLKKNENSKSWNTYYELAGSCACFDFASNSKL